MSLLKAEPPARVTSLPELFAIAHALEEEAASRYAALAEEMEALQMPRVAAVFRHLVDEKRGHAQRIEDWARGTTGMLPDHRLLRWQPPETFDEEEARQLALSRLASAYRALSMAVRNEERAFALWTYIAAHAEAPAIRAAAERMAGEELRHAALLRRERRRAYHEERGDAAGSGRPSPLGRAIGAELRLASLLPILAEAEPDAGQATVWRRLAGEASTMAAEGAALAGEETLPGSAPTASAVRTDLLTAAWHAAEQASEAYLDAADAGRDEAVVRRLQSLAERAIAHVAVLRHAAAAPAGRMLP
ncbi:ferritin-like domain-containing protein [Roseicella frigidaeris]|uniref:Rubrerythrin family protein n=1 Tax=Roseicella frigidaeris TaxID=2230885 RepID=A0A327MAD7_9PROT|nr:ferritin family protein [Roseicella frigidaeris]RAI57088.1 rubrerythrin family protein [Roseicella frigidaeris]